MYIRTILLAAIVTAFNLTTFHARSQSSRGIPDPFPISKEELDALYFEEGAGSWEMIEGVTQGIYFSFACYASFDVSVNLQNDQINNYEELIRAYEELSSVGSISEEERVSWKNASDQLHHLRAAVARDKKRADDWLQFTFFGLRGLRNVASDYNLKAQLRDGSLSEFYADFHILNFQFETNAPEKHHLSICPPNDDHANIDTVEGRS